jgi:hypothetical protein
MAIARTEPFVFVVWKSPLLARLRRTHTRRPFPVDVAPSKGEEFAAPHPGRHGAEQERPHPRRRLLEQLADLVRP